MEGHRFVPVQVQAFFSDEEEKDLFPQLFTPAKKAISSDEAMPSSAHISSGESIPSPAHISLSDEDGHTPVLSPAHVSLGDKEENERILILSPSDEEENESIPALSVAQASISVPIPSAVQNYTPPVRKLIPIISPPPVDPELKRPVHFPLPLRPAHQNEDEKQPEPTFKVGYQSRKVIEQIQHIEVT